MPVRRCYWRHASVVGRWSGFDPRADLVEDALGGWSNGKTPGLHPGDRGSTPRRSTVHSGLNPVPVAWRRAGPHGLRAHRLMGGHRPGVAEIRVRLPVGPLREFCSWKVAGYGLPDRFAKAASPRGVRVRIPRLPLRRPDGEEDDHASVLTRSPGFESWSGQSARARPGGEREDHTSLLTRSSGFESWPGCCGRSSWSRRLAAKTSL